MATLPHMICDAEKGHRMLTRSTLLARLVSAFSSTHSHRLGKVLFIMVAIFAAMAGGEPAYAEWCSRC